MSRHAATPTRKLSPVASLSPQLRAAATAAAVAGGLGLALGVPAWTGPAQISALITTAPARSMVFSYTAAVPRTAAYDSTTATSPDPIFRNLTNRVDVHYAYRGVPGTIHVNASLSAPSGWHSTIPLAGPSTFTAGTYQGTVQLHLNALDAKAQAAARVIGIPADQITVAINPVINAGASRFAPALHLNLTSLQLSLTGGAKTLRVSDTTTRAHRGMVARRLSAAGHAITVRAARLISTGLLLLSLLAAVVLLLLARGLAPHTEGASIRRRYPSLLVRVAPMPTPPGRPVVDVTDFATLARLAERYGLLVLHWTRSGVDTFVVQDDATTYRYRTGSGQLRAPTATATVGTVADDEASISSGDSAESRWPDSDTILPRA